MAPYNREIIRGGGERAYHRLRMCVRLHIEQAQRSKNLRIQNEITERGKGQNSFTERKTGECFQWKTDGSCSKGQSCSVLHAPAAGDREPAQEKVGNTGSRSRQKHATENRVLGRKAKEQTSSSVQTDVQYHTRTVEVRVLKLELESLVYGEQNAKDRHVVICILPYASATSLKSDAFMAIVAHTDMLDGEDKPSKRSKKRGYSRTQLLF